MQAAFPFCNAMDTLISIIIIIKTVTGSDGIKPLIIAH